MSTEASVTTSRKRAEEEVLQLLSDYRQTRKTELRDRIVMQYTNLVESVARRFSGSAEPVEDLIQEGYIGLITAIDLYDPTKNVKFSTYATHFIIGQIKHFLRDRGKIIKEPAWLQELNQRLTRAIEALTQQLGRQPTNQEIAQTTGMSEETVSEIMMTREVFKVTSIHGGGDSDEDNGGAVDMERQKGVDVAVSFQLPVEERIVLETAMQKLKELEQTVIWEFYFKDRNQTEIARQLGISCNYVSHILRNSTKKLKKILATDELRDAQMKMAQMRRRMEEQQAFIEQHTVVDPQTRLYNRRYYETRLEEEICRASRLGVELSVLLIGLHGLPVFLRTYGTLKYDEAVGGIAGLLQRTVRRVDIVTRFSDETFALILPHTGQNVRVVACRVHRTLSGWLEERGWHAGRAPLKINAGWALYPGEAQHSAELTALAEQRLQSDTEPELMQRAA
ncbi:MAG: sigma-70 family RNA polymerase sigma factor [Chloroherpetonaceae bacterium]|nr:sigma-70 family RNA polymerase sigma factor [Chthonomonadaceae bacterium]MDW8206523.1 sigma-70 family RNA polymerase sigma factor [Chloroherpetonaceae bacterium]